MAGDDWGESPEAYAARMEREWSDEFRTKNERKRGDYGADAPAGEPLISPTVIDARSWHGQPRPVREFLDDRKWFRMGMVSNFSGPGGVGKTLACLQAGVACAAGTQWLGRDIRPGPALFYSAEEPLEEIHARVDEICEAENLFLDQLQHPFEIVDTSWHPHAELIEVSQSSKGMKLEMTPMFHWLKQRAMALKPQVLFIDNRAQVVVGNENDRVVAGFSMRMFGTLAKDTGAAVIVLSHPSISGSKTGASGSTQWFNTARSNVFMSMTDGDDDDSDIVNLSKDDGRRVLKNNKTNYGPVDSEANVIWDHNRWKCTDKRIDVSALAGPPSMPRPSGCSCT